VPGFFLPIRNAGVVELAYTAALEAAGIKSLVTLTGPWINGLQVGGVIMAIKRSDKGALTVRLFLIIGLAVILMIDIGVASVVEKYAINSYARYPQKEKYQHKTLEGPFIIGAKSVALWLLDFAERNDKAVTALSTLFIAIFTIVLAFATRTLVKMARKQDEVTRIIERAYIKMSHRPPGLTFYNDRGTAGTITNVALTIRVNPRDEPLPKVPDYQEPNEAQAPNAFLVTDEQISTSQSLQIGIENVQGIHNGESWLTVYGFVDYIDKFNERHRGGYARRFNRDAPTNNLQFVSQPGYNYDRKRKNGEGHDWGEEAPS